MKKKVLGSIIFIFILFSVIFISIGVRSSQNITNEQEIKNTVIGALKIYEKIVFPPQYTKSPDIPIPPDVVNKKVKEVTDECYKYFSSKSGWLDNRIEVFKNAVFFEAYTNGGIRTVKDRITDIKFLEINIEGDTAKVVADVYEENKAVLSVLDESKISTVDLEKLNNINVYKTSSGNKEDLVKKKEIEELVKKLPKKTDIVDRSGIIRYYYNLIKENGKWKIISENLTFIPGDNMQN